MKILLTIICSLAFLAACAPQCIAAVQVRVVNGSPQAEFGATEVRTAVERAKPKGEWQIAFRLVSKSAAAGIDREGFRIRTSVSENRQHIDILAIDPAGLLYGGLEVAEVVRTLGIEHVNNDMQNPYMQMRGTKFNIPLDARTPSYTDVCDAAQINIPEMWSFEFWREYIDTLARYRYNYVSLWNLHPFPSLVQVPEYPDIALEDVWRSKVDWEEN